MTQAEDLKEVFFFPLDLKPAKNTTGETVLELYGVTKTGYKIKLIDSSFKPYFYALPKNVVNQNLYVQKLKSLRVKEGEESIQVLKLEKVRKEVQNEKKTLFKITAGNKDHLKLLRNVIQRLDETEDVYEHHLPTPTKYYLSKKIVPHTLCKAKVTKNLEIEKISQLATDLIEPKILAFKLETTSQGAIPDSKKDPIITISLKGSGGYVKTITWKRFENPRKEIKIVGGELDLIEEFKKSIDEHKPDILIGYESEKFDLPYLKNRCEKYGTTLNINPGKSNVYEASKLQPKGFLHLDLQKFVKSILKDGLKTETCDLNSVSEELLNQNRLNPDLTIQKIKDMWDIGLAEDLATLAERSAKDAELCFQLAKELLPLQLQFVKLLQKPLYEINKMAYSSAVEAYLTKHYAENNKIVPNPPKYTEITSRFKKSYTGGFVKEPTPGLYENIHVVDYRSLYPAIIVSHNIGPDTLNCVCCKTEKNKVMENLWFCTKSESVISKLVKELIDRRKRVTEIIKKTPKDNESYPNLAARSHALKILANAFYGYLGYPYSKWYSIDCAQAITYLGRKYVHSAIEAAKQNGFDTLYADTDSAFLVKKTPDADIKTFLTRINSNLPDPMELEYEGFYSTGLFISKKDELGVGAKKRYALLNQDGSITIRGVEAIRGDWSGIAKKAQQHIIELILKEKNANKAVKHVQEVLKQIEERKVDLDDLVIKVRLTRDLDQYQNRGPHVAAAELARSKGYRVGRGFITKFIIGEGVGKISDRVILAEDATIDKYDPTYYAENQIIRATFKLLELFGYSEDKIKEGQTTLDTWGK